MRRLGGRGGWYSRLAACTTSLTSLMRRLICWLVRSSSFSCRCKFSRNCGLSARHSVNSRGCRPTPILGRPLGPPRSRSQHHALSPTARRPGHIVQHPPPLQGRNTNTNTNSYKRHTLLYTSKKQ